MGAALAIACTCASAQEDKGRYFGFSVGETQYGALCQGTRGPCDNGDTGARGFFGYQFHRHFAVELGAATLGKAPPDPSIQRTATDVSAHATAFDLVGLGILPVSERLRLYGKLGVYAGQVKTTGIAVIPILGIPVPVDDTENVSGATFGAGVELRLSPNFAVRGDWQRYSKLVGSDLDVMSVGLLLRF